LAIFSKRAMTDIFSAQNRPSILTKLGTEEFDVLIIGGGITGAGIALDAASRGLKTALIEKNDFAYGTSSKSTKLIHGGLRYLKQLEFGLVKEVGSERAVVHKLAPHLVLPEKMLLPLSEKKGLGYWLTSIGLRIYDWLAGVAPQDQRKMLTRSQTLRQEPLLQKNDIKGGAIYAEYRTDDARLTIEIIKCAFHHGAVIASYAMAEDFLYENSRVDGVAVCDILSGHTFSIRAKVVVNAAGPWVDQLRTINHSRVGKRLHLTKGVHIVVPFEKLPIRQAIYFDVDDGRMIFAIPRGRTTYIGTTDTNYDGNIDDVVTTAGDAAYLLQAVNATFQSTNLSIADVESSWAGLRPLIHEEGKSASELSRKDEIFESPTGLISIAGGKLTGYRKMAERVVTLLIKKHFHNRRLSDCTTNAIKLPGAAFKNTSEVNSYIEAVTARIKPYGLDHDCAKYLVHNYGKQTNDILILFETHPDGEPDIALMKAELHFSYHHEMIMTPCDFFIRRTGTLYFNIHRLQRSMTPILSEFKRYFSWNDLTLARHKSDLEKIINASTAF